MQVDSLLQFNIKSVEAAVSPTGVNNIRLSDISEDLEDIFMMSGELNDKFMRFSGPDADYAVFSAG